VVYTRHTHQGVYQEEYYAHHTHPGTYTRRYYAPQDPLTYPGWCIYSRVHLPHTRVGVYIQQGAPPTYPGRVHIQQGAPLHTRQGGIYSRVYLLLTSGGERHNEARSTYKPQGGERHNEARSIPHPKGEEGTTRRVLSLILRRKRGTTRRVLSLSLR